MHLSKAFTMIEILIALFILSSSIYVLSGLQVKLLLRVYKDKDQIEKIYLLKEKVFSFMCKPSTIVQAKKDDRDNPEVSFIPSVITSHSKSMLHEYEKYLELVEVQALWTYCYIKRQEEMVAIISTGKKE